MKSIKEKYSERPNCEQAVLHQKEQYRKECAQRFQKWMSELDEMGRKMVREDLRAQGFDLDRWEIIGLVE